MSETIANIHIVTLGEIPRLHPNIPPMPKSMTNARSQSGKVRTKPASAYSGSSPNILLPPRRPVSGARLASSAQRRKGKERIPRGAGDSDGSAAKLHMEKLVLNEEAEENSDHTDVRHTTSAAKLRRQGKERIPRRAGDSDGSAKLHMKELVLNEEAEANSHYTDVRHTTNHYSGFPVGAHTAGYYAKKRKDQLNLETRRKSASFINTLIKSSLATEIPSESEATLNISLPRTISLTENASIGEHLAARKISLTFSSDTGLESAWFPEPDIEEIEFALARLSDVDSSPSKLVESITKLAELCQIETGTCIN